MAASTSLTEPTAAPTARHWTILAAGTLTAAAAAAFVAGAAFLIPALHHSHGLSLPAAGLVAAMPSIGTALTLIAWGWLADRTGERLCLVAGAGLSALAIAGAMIAAAAGDIPVVAFAFLLAGGASASANSASGRVVVGWFPAHRRGLAMGIRQMSQPAGAALAALSMPVLAHAHGITWALMVPLVLATVATVVSWAVVINPPRPERPATREARRTENPYLRSAYLWRVHGASVLLVLPQGLMQSFLLVWLIVGHGWAPGAAGVVVTVSQVLGATARILVGVWSDRAGARLGPLRRVAAGSCAAFAAFAAAEAFGVPGAVAVSLAVAAAVLSVSDNGLAFTAVAEHAGARWAGRALGMQNTAQFVAMSVATPLLAVPIGAGHYWPVFAGAAVLCVLAVPITPRRDVGPEVRAA